MPAREQVAQACAYLRMLLLRPGEYRTLWERRLDQPSPATISYPAVAEVLAGAACPNGDGPGTDALTALSRQALEGDTLTPETLDLFVTAFGFSDRHARRLRDLLNGSDTVRVISGHATLPPDLYRGGPAGYDTLALHELHVLGPDGLPAEHQTIQVIKAADGVLESFPYRFDTDELVVEVIRGGHVGDRIYRITDSLYCVDIVLARPLALGETALMQLRTTFFYKYPPPPEFRRGVMRATRDLTIWLRFHPNRVPARVFQARWDRIDQARIIERHEVELDGELSVHSRYDSLEQAIVGFYWEWS